MTDEQLIETIARAMFKDDQINRLDIAKAALNACRPVIEALQAENARLRQAMHDIYEVYAGSEGFKPETCPEAYLQDHIKEMAYIAGKHKRRRWWR